MPLKPPTRTFPKLVMKDWPERERELLALVDDEKRRIRHEKELADFTRVVEEIGVLEQKETPLAKRESKHD